MVKKVTVKAKKAKDPKKPTEGSGKTGPGKKTANPNTGPIFYFSNASVAKKCAADKKKIKDKCDSAEGKKESENAHTKADVDKKGKLGKLAGVVKDSVTALDTVGRTATGYQANGDNDWIADHCKGLWVKPLGGDNINKFRDELENAKNLLKTNAKTLVEKAGGKLVDMAKDKAIQFGERALAEEAAGGAAALVAIEFPPAAAVIEGVTQVVVTATGIWSAVTGAIDTAKVLINDGPKIIAGVQSILAQADKITDLIKGVGLTDIMADAMAAIAYANPCIKARKCMLVPYDKTDEARKQAKSGQGCCPGQTGHHVLPDAMFRKPDAKGKNRDNKEKLQCWGNYSAGGAPTMCLEGTGNNATNGSHGAAHAMTKKIIDDHRSKHEMKYTTARDEITMGLALVFGCDVNCLRAQLDKYYCEAYTCGKPGQDCTSKLKEAQVYPHDGNPSGGGAVPPPSDTRQSTRR